MSISEVALKVQFNLFTKELLKSASSVVYSLIGISCLCTTALAEPQLAKVQTIPESIKNEICKSLSLEKKSCRNNDRIKYLQAYKLDNNELLMFFYLQDTEQRYHRGLTIPVKINAEAKWDVGLPFVGEPQKINKQRNDLWMHAQFNSTAKTPRLLYSKTGMKWTEVSLPDVKQASYQLETINKFCLQPMHLFIELEYFDKNYKPLSNIWKADLSKAVSMPPKLSWQKTDSKALNAKKCVVGEAKDNSWLIQNGETLTLFQNDAKQLTLKIPHSLSISSAKTPKIQEALKTQVTTKKNQVKDEKSIAIQVGAYSNHNVVDELVSSIQQMGFRTFTQTVVSKDNSDKKIKKIYVGPYLDRESAKKELNKLKIKFSKNKSVESAFILKFR